MLEYCQYLSSPIYDTMDILVGETRGYKINLVNKCGTASLGYF